MRNSASFDKAFYCWGHVSEGSIEAEMKKSNLMYIYCNGCSGREKKVWHCEEAQYKRY